MNRLLAAELCQDFDEETGRVETGLDPIASPVCDETAMNVLRLKPASGLQGQFYLGLPSAQRQGPSPSSPEPTSFSLQKKQSNQTRDRRNILKDSRQAVTFHTSNFILSLLQVFLGQLHVKVELPLLLLKFGELGNEGARFLQ